MQATLSISTLRKYLPDREPGDQKKLGIAKRSWRASQSGEKILEDCRTFTATATSGLILAGSAF